MALVRWTGEEQSLLYYNCVKKTSLDGLVKILPSRTEFGILRRLARLSVSAIDKPFWSSMYSFYYHQFYEKHKDEIIDRMDRWRKENKKVLEEWYVRNRARIRRYQKRYYKSHKKEIMKRHKKYFLENKERVREQRRLYYLRNKEKIKDEQRQYYWDIGKKVKV